MHWIRLPTGGLLARTALALGVTVERQPTLALVARLCAALRDEGVSYCHWKSTAALDRSASGENDLDLLVARSDGQRFTEILWRLGFKEGCGTPEVPGVRDYYGYDGASSRFVHVHAHYQLVLGHDLTKNYRLPIERAFLDAAVQGDLFRLPPPELELIVFVVRMVLKHSTWDALLGRQGALSAAEREELTYLQAQGDRARTQDLLRRHLPFVEAALWDDCLQALQVGCPLWSRVQVGKRLQGRLKGCARRSPIADVALKLLRRVAYGVGRRVWGHAARKRLANGGGMVALVGGDGSGKSTAVDELHTWLGSEFETRKVHLGKPPWSPTTILVRGALKVGRTLGLYAFMRAPVQYALAASPPAFPGYPWLLREVCTARDRYLAYVKARRFATNGGIVICDRFPLPQVRLMDGPLGEQMSGDCRPNWLLKLLTKLEKRYYRPILPPEVLIVLKLEPAASVQRKPDEAPASVWARSAEIWELDWRQTSAEVVHVGRSREEVLSELKDLVWSRL